MPPYYPYINQTPNELRSQLSSGDLSVGVDGMTVAIPSPKNASLSGWQTKSFSRTHTRIGRSVVPLVANVRNGPALYMTYIDSPHQVATYLRFNPSRVLDPLGTNLATVDEALSLLTDVVFPLVPAWIPSPSLDGADIYRLDLAVDIESGPHSQQVLRDCEVPLYRPQHHTYMYLNGPGRVGTMGRMSVTRPRVSIYDKGAESKTPPERLRFEVQFRRPALRSAFPGGLAELSEVSARQQFQHELGEVATVGNSRSPRIVDLPLSDADMKTFYEMIGKSAAEQSGVHRPLPQNAQRRHKKFLAKFGISSADELLDRA